MANFKDLESEFSPIKQLSTEELDKDTFIQSLNDQKGLARDIAWQQKKEKLNYSFNIRMKRLKERREFYEPLETSLEAKPKSKGRKIRLVGLDELRQTLKDREEMLSHVSEGANQDYTLIQGVSSEFIKKESAEFGPATTTSRRVKRHVALVPMDPEYLAKARNALKRTDGSFDASEPIDMETNSEGSDNDDDVLMDASLQFHEIDVFLYEQEPDATEESTAVKSAAEEASSTVSVHVNGPLSTNMPVSESDQLQFREDDIKLMKKTVLAQLASPQIPDIDKSILAKPCKELLSVFSRTIEDGESHMALLIGSHGLGKTALVEKAMENLASSESGVFIAIRLSGSLQATEQHVVREIARQLDAALHTEKSADSSTFEKRAISDTFANILLTLETSVESRKDKESTKELPTRIIFVIDEIEKYTDTPRQMLLYNLFELTQNPKVPICVLGVTTKVNIRDMFEKRVRSRFSQRIITTHLAGSLEEFWGNASQTLRIEAIKFAQFGDQQYPKKWNEYIDTLDKMKPVLQTLYQCFFTTKSIGEFKQSCMLPIRQISSAAPFPDPDVFPVYPRSLVGGVEAKLAACSNHELMMVIAAARWVHRSENSNVNFNLAYNEYERMMKDHNIETTTVMANANNANSSHIDSLALAGIKVTKIIHSAAIMRDSWGRIYRIGLLPDAISSSSEINAHNIQNMYKGIVIEDSRMLQLDILLEEVRALVAGDPMMERFTKI